MSKPQKIIPVADTYIGKEEAQAAYDVIMSGWISKGKVVEQFERAFAEKTGARFAVSSNNGTTALHACLAALEIGKGDEVIVPDITFISTANAVLYQNATPVIAECDPRTYNVSVKNLEAKLTPRTRAIIPVDMNGMPINYDVILDFARKHNLHVIADSAESLGASYKGRKIGSIAPIHMFSFFPNKNITTGEGGMITTDDEEFAKKAARIINQGQEGRYNHTVLGYNYRMNNIAAAIGLEQLKRLDFVVQEKEKIAKKYDEALKDKKNIAIPFQPDFVTQHSWYMYTISVPEEKRDAIVQQLKEDNIETRLSFPPIHIQPYYQQRFGFKDEDLPVSLKAWKKLINLPIYAALGEHQEYVIEKVIKACEK